MTLTDLYMAAIRARDESGERFGVAKHEVPTGVIYCCIRPVAGCSVVRKHDRVEYTYRPTGDEWGKTISRAKAKALIEG